jgi:hypothetical protein
MVSKMNLAEQANFLLLVLMVYKIKQVERDQIEKWNQCLKYSGSRKLLYPEINCVHTCLYCILSLVNMVQLYHAALDMPSYLSRGMEMGVHNFKWTNIILKQMVRCIKGRLLCKLY